jgi:hypothetical protein
VQLPRIGNGLNGSTGSSLGTHACGHLVRHGTPRRGG